MKDIAVYNDYVIKDKKTLKKILSKEKNIYRQYMYPNLLDYLWGVLKSDNVIKIMRWQRWARISSYYDYKYHTTQSIWYLLRYLYAVKHKNIMGNQFGLELNTDLINEGLIIYHFNNVINTGSKIGKNCHIHGTVVIGNNGKDNDCPIIGNNVMIGAGAKVIGPVTIADNIKVAAGAVVVTSFTESGITIGGVPARKLK